MKALVKLRLVQSKATLRNIFGKPLSAILTVAVILIYATMAIPLILNAGLPPISGPEAQRTILSVAGFGLMMCLMTLLQKKKSLFFLGDAFYFYTGPFLQRRILAVYALDLLGSALVFGLLSLMPLVFGSRAGSMPLGFILIAFISSAAAVYAVLVINGILYIRELCGDRNPLGVYLIPAVLVLCILAAVVVHLTRNGFSPVQGMAGLMGSPVFDWIPLFGWARAAMTGVLSGDSLLLAGGLALLAAAAVTLTAILIRQKGDFQERSMMDAETFTEYHQKVKSGRGTGSEKVRSAAVRFRKGEGAILSKNLLIALKGRDLFRPQDLLVIGIYLGMAVFAGMGYLAFASMLMFWMFVTAGSGPLVDELQHHYVYLIPGNALRKLLYTFLVPFLRNALVLLISLLAGGVVLGAGAGRMLTAAMFCLSLLLVFMAGNVLSLRLLRSRNSRMVEQMLRMLLAALAVIPGALVYFLALIAAGDAADLLAGPVFCLINLLLSLLVLLICSPMMQGNEISAD